MIEKKILYEIQQQPTTAKYSMRAITGDNSTPKLYVPKFHLRNTITDRLNVQALNEKYNG